MRAEIRPCSLNGTITAPPSKSAGHRSLICAALCDREVLIHNCGESDDMTATIGALKALGASVIRNGSTVKITPFKRNNKNITIDLLESGSTARFMIPVAAALGADNITFTGRGRLPERPFGAIVEALTLGGVTCSSDSLPMTVSGQLTSGVYRLPGNISSQYISGLLLALSIVPGESRIELTSKLESRAYVDMTLNELKVFGADITADESGYTVNGKPSLIATTRTVEGDWSQAAFFLSAGAVLGDVTVNGLNMNSLQGDKAILDLLKRFGADIELLPDGARVKKSRLCGITIDASQIPDLVPILAVTAASAEGKTVITNAERLRIKESDRLFETATRLRAFGIDATETSDGLVIIGSKPHSADITSAGDHRIVMAFSVLSATADKISTIKDPLAINKSYPTFFEDFKSLGGECNVF